MNPLERFPKLREVLYMLMWVLALVLMVWQAAVGMIDGMQQPTALKVMLGIFPLVAGYIGYTAQQNVDTPERRQQRALRRQQREQ